MEVWTQFGVAVFAHQSLWCVHSARVTPLGQFREPRSLSTPFSPSGAEGRSSPRCRSKIQLRSRNGAFLLSAALRFLAVIGWRHAPQTPFWRGINFRLPRRAPLIKKGWHAFSLCSRRWSVVGFWSLRDGCTSSKTSDRTHPAAPTPLVIASADLWLLKPEGQLTTFENLLEFLITMLA